MTPYRWGRSAGVGRRRFLASAGLAATGAASLALIGCGDDDDADDADDADARTPTATLVASPSAAATSGVSTGGVTYETRNFANMSTLDPHRASTGTEHYILAASMSRLVEYPDPAGETLAGDLSDGLPEQPDELTMLVRLKANVIWHDKPPVNGRALTTDDVVFFVERQTAGLDRDGNEDPTFGRQARMSIIDKAEAVDAETVRFTLSRPDATLLDLLAGPFSFVVAPEAVEAFSDDQWASLDASTLIGTGPFVLTDLAVGESASFARHGGYHEPGLPYADGARFQGTLGDAAAGEASFRGKHIDWWAPPPQTSTDALLADLPEVVRLEFGDPNPVLCTFATDRPPWNDARLLRAVNRAFDRRFLCSELHDLGGLPSATVPWPASYWALPQDDLALLPGYLEDKEEDFAEARSLWEAAAGPSELVLSIADQFLGVFPSTAEVVPAQLSSVLGASITTAIVTYEEITVRLADKSLSFWFGWGVPVETPDPTGDTVAAYHSSSPGNIWGLNQPGGLVVEGLDEQLERLQVTLEREERREILLDIQRTAAEVGCLGPMYFYNYYNQQLHWPYFHSSGPSPFYFGHDQKRHWLDQDDPSFQGRP
jgi:ABC-type transport system substrate-binding protein